MNINLHGATNPVATNSTTANPAITNPATANTTTNTITTSPATTNTTTNTITTNAIDSGAATTHRGDATHDKMGSPLAVEKNTPEVDSAAGVNKALDPKGVATEGEAVEDAPKTDSEALATIVEQLSDVVTLMNKGLAFSVDEDSGSAIVKVMDIDTGDIIRQIPSEEALELAQKLQDVKGLLLKTQA